MVIFYSYVKLPEGILIRHRWCGSLWMVSGARPCWIPVQTRRQFCSTGSDVFVTGLFGAEMSRQCCFLAAPCFLKWLRLPPINSPNEPMGSTHHFRIYPNRESKNIKTGSRMGIPPGVFVYSMYIVYLLYKIAHSLSRKKKNGERSWGRWGLA